MPVMLFFFMGFEHSVVNMFLFPSALLMGGNFSVMDYLLWNEIPTVLGNLFGAYCSQVWLFTLRTFALRHNALCSPLGAG